MIYNETLVLSEVVLRRNLSPFTATSLNQTKLFNFEL